MQVEVWRGRDEVGRCEEVAAGFKTFGMQPSHARMSFSMQSA